MEKYHTQITILTIFNQAERNGLKIQRGQWPEQKPYNGFSHAQRVRKWQAILLAIDMRIIPRPTFFVCDICGAYRADAKLQYHSEDCLSMSGHYPLCKNCHHILHQRFQEPVEWTELIKKNFLSGRWFTLLTCDPTAKKKKKVCKICMRSLSDCSEFLYNNELFAVCFECKEHFFESKCEAQIIGMLDKAIDLVIEKHVYLKYALNVAKEIYTLEEAIRKTALATKESGGKSVDIFSVGKRLSGNFKSRM